MTASEFIALPDAASADAVFARIEQMAAARGVAIRKTLSGSTLKLEFADGQRIIINHDTQSHKIWLAAHSAGDEYSYNGSHWVSQQEHGELFARLDGIISQLIQSNHLNARPGKLINIERPSFHTAPLAEVADQRPGASPLKKLAVLGLLAWLGYAGFQHYAHKGAPADGQLASFTSAADNVSDSKCDARFPPNGATHIFPAGNIQPDHPNNTEVTLQNDHSHSFMAIFTAPKSVIPYLSVLVQARQSARISLPAGQYDLMFSVGNTWCNLRTGFANGQRIKLSGSLTVLPEQAVRLSAQSSGSNAAEFQIFINSAAPETLPPATQFTGNGVMEILKHRDGHFHIAGTINGAAVTYLIDTGASLTSLTRETAQRAGIVDCKPSTFKTANGSVTGCIALVPQLTIGNYQMQNVNVAVMPNLDVDLLGMNMLGHFAITQANGVMRLSSR